MPSSSSGAPIEHHITVAAETDQLAVVRARVAALAREAGAQGDVVEQFELAVSELATNVIQHADTEQITVAFHQRPGCWVLDVSNAPGAIELDDPHLPDAAQLSGRGLFIVQSLMDTVEVVDVDGDEYIRCTKRAG